MNRQQRRTADKLQRSGKMTVTPHQVQNAIASLKNFQALGEVPEAMAGMVAQVKEMHLIVGALVEDYQIMHAEVEAHNRVLPILLAELTGRDVDVIRQMQDDLLVSLHSPESAKDV